MPVVRPSVCKHSAQIAFSTRQIAGSQQNLHTIVSRRACIQDVLKVNVEVKDHVIGTLLWWCQENRFFSRAHGCIMTKLSLSLTSPFFCPIGFLPHPNPQMAVSLRCEWRHSWHGETVCQTDSYTVRSGVLSLRALTLWSSITSLSFQIKYQAARCLNLGISHSVIDGLVFIIFLTLSSCSRGKEKWTVLTRAHSNSHWSGRFSSIKLLCSIQQDSVVTLYWNIYLLLLLLYRWLSILFG